MFKEPKPPKEKPWSIHSWEDLRKELATMKPRSKLFEIIKTEVKKRGHWKNASRGTYKPLDDN